MLKHQFWNWYASCYDTLTHLSPYRDMMTDLVEALDLRPGMRVLEIGCGTGNLTVHLARTAPDCRITAVDFSAAMLQRAERKCAGCNVQFHVADLNDPLPFPDGAFDRIVSTNVLYALQDPQQTLTRLFHQLSPGGRMAHAIPRQGFQMAKVFSAHLSSLSGLRKISVLPVFPSYLLLGMFNLPLIRRGEQGSFYFPTERQARTLQQACGNSGQLRKTYADQDWLLLFERSAHYALGLSSQNR